ncbi:MAG: Xaa-Pro aminopeptidase [Legionellaceae bacterium]|nr:Xaa-Pro aminopeptidase [Legionellaceae bacterium]
MIATQEYQDRRQKLAQQLPLNSVALIPAAKETLRNGDAHHRFRQASDFYYLTGFNEPESVLVIINTGSNAVSILFNRVHDPIQEQWTGARLGQDAAVKQLGVDKAYPIDTLDSQLPVLLQDKQSIYYAIGHDPSWDKQVIQAWQIVKSQARRGVKAAESFCDLSPILSELRLFKSKAEIALMRRAADITVAAHKRAMQACSHAHTEYELEAELLFELNRRGCRNVAYDSIVASGNNACVLHYTDNNKSLHFGELVLIDAGGEFENYAADVTRVFPVSGQFSSDQRQIYDLVLRAQRAGIACVRPGCAWDKIQRVIIETLTAGLVELGILAGNVDDLIKSEAYLPFYMHNSGHWLGLDVHDCGRYKINGQWRALEPGMVLTVEPGLYFRHGLDGVDPRWWGIGVRIEDDILVTTDGHENLTGDLMVDAHEIEAYMRG